MGVTKTMISAGNGVDKAKQGDTITMEYTGTLYDEKAADKKGKQCVNHSHCARLCIADQGIQIRLFGRPW